MFTINLVEPINKSSERTLRTAVRAVIVRDNKLLMVQTKLGDVKFVGGGLEANESHRDALHREALEEAGIIIEIGDFLGTAYQLRPDYKASDKVFEMTSYYYAATIIEENHSLSLSHNEIDLETKPVWVDIDEAIHMNSVVCDKIPWLNRELKVLHILKTNDDNKNLF